MTAAPALAAPAEGAAPVEAPIPEPRRRRDGGRHLPALAGYFVLAVAMLWPVVRHFPTRMLSAVGDGSAFVWNYWAIPAALWSAENPFVTDAIFFPVGARTSFNTNIPLEAIVSWPFAQVFGLAVAVNLMQLTAVVLSGFFAYLLAFHECEDRRAAFFAGVVFTWVPYRFVHMGVHHNLNHTELLPLGVLTIVLLYERPTRFRASAAGLVFGLTVLTDLNYAVFLALAGGLIAVWHLRKTLTRVVMARWVQAAAVAVFLSAPLLVHMVLDLTVYDWLDPLSGWGGASGFSADLLSWVTPSGDHPWWGDTFAATNRRATGGERTAFPGFVVLALAVAGAVVVRRRRRFLWATMAVTFALLSFGPFLHVNGETGGRFEYLDSQFSWPMPYFLYRLVPVVNGVRVPGRFSIVAILALSVLAAMALARLGRGRPVLQWLLPSIAVALAIVEFLPPQVPWHETRIPPAYGAIAADPGRGAVLEVPMAWRSGFGRVPADAPDPAIYMYYATKHQKPLVSGFVARYPDRKMTELSQIPVYRQVLTLQGALGFNDPVWFTASDLRSLGIGYVVFHRDRPAPAALQYISRLGLPNLADDGEVIVWKVP